MNRFGITSAGLALAFCFLAAPSFAADKPMEGWFGNTMIGCRSPGAEPAPMECHEWFNPDGTLVLFMVKRSDGIETAGNFREGKWYIDDKGMLCRSMPPMQRPANAPAPAAGDAAPAVRPPAGPICGGPGHRTVETNFYKPGAKWDDVNMSNKPEHFELIAGHH